MYSLCLRIAKGVFLFEKNKAKLMLDNLILELINLCLRKNAQYFENVS